MADKSAIEWTGATWNPITGCSIKSPGCSNCYAQELAGTRLKHHPSRAGLTREVNGHHVWTGEIRFNDQWLDQPLRWTRPRDIFVCAHGDLFHEEVKTEWLDSIFDTMRRAYWHRFQVLTKRTAIMATALRWEAPMPHVWIGTSVERQQEADERRRHLASIAAGGWNTWVSYEPALGLVGWAGWEFIRWLVSGGESGPRARPSHPDWHRIARDWCAESSIPYFFKQWGEWGLEDPARKVVPHALADDGTLYEMQDLAYPDGKRRGAAIRANHDRANLHTVYRVGKKAAGALLDGVEHKALPA